MKLLRAEIENFGKFHGVKLDFSDGLNTVCRENGWGKTTLAVFLKAMLYGLPASSTKKLDRNERKKYAPWQGGQFGGSLTFETNRGRFRVERFFGSKESEDTFVLRDLTTRMPSSVYSANLGTDLFGIDAEGFERSVYLSERELDLSGADGSIQAKLTGVAESENDLANLQNALSILDKQRRIYQMTGNKGRVAELSRLVAEKQERYEEGLRKLKWLTDAERSLSAERERLAELRGQRDRAQKVYEQVLQAGKQEEIANRLAELKSKKKTAEDRLGAIRAQLGNDPPTPAELEEANRVWNRIQSNSAVLKRNNRVEQPDLDRLSELDRQLAAGTDPEAICRSVSDELNRLSDAEAELRVLQNRKAAVPPVFAAKPIPARADLERQSGMLREAEELRRNEQKRSHNRLLSVFAIFLLLSGAVAPGVGIFLPAFRLPLCIAGGILLAAGILLFAVWRSRNRRQAATKLRRAKELEGQVAAFLSSYAIPAPSLREKLDRLQTEADRARRNQGEEDENKERIRKQTQAALTLRNQIAAQLVPFGIAPDDPRQGLQVLRERIEERNRVRQIVAGRKAENRTLDQAIDNDLQTLDRLFSRVPGLANLDSHEQKLRRAEELCGDYLRAQADLREQNRALAEYVAAHPATDLTKSPRPDPAACKERLEILNRETDEKAAQIRETQRQIEDLREQTDLLPERKDEIETLKEELATAESNLKLIRTTAELLEQARISLTSRYLDGMQKHFTSYLSLLAASDTPKTELGADLTVGVRDGGKTRTTEYYSRGWQELFSFCARLSLVDALFPEGELPFLLLDDPFSGLDADHLAAAKALLGKLSCRFQILYLVCHPARS